MSVETWVDRLEKALGNEKWFPATLAELKAAHLDAATLKQICRKFAHETATSKADALGAIQRHHQSLITSRQKAAATGGRTAA